MKKILKLIIISILLLQINNTFGNVDRDRDGNDRSSYDYYAIFQKNRVTGKIYKSYTFDESCSEETKENHKDSTINRNITGFSVSGCNNVSGFLSIDPQKELSCLISSSNFSNKIGRNQTLTITFSDGGRSIYPINLNYSLWQGGGKDMYTATLEKLININKYENIHIKCDEEGRKTEEITTVRITHDPDTNSRINTINGIVPPKIKITVNDGNCINKNDTYYCYANNDIKFQLNILEEGNILKVNNIKSYILNENNACFNFHPSNCPFQDTSIGPNNFDLKNSHFEKVGTYNIEFSGEVKNGNNILNKSLPEYIKLTIVPNPNKIQSPGKDVFNNNDGSDLSEKSTFTSKTENSTSTELDENGNQIAYANLRDEYQYTFNLIDEFGNKIPNSFIDKDSLNINNDKIQKTLLKTDGNGSLEFSIFSAQPIENYIENFKIKVNKWRPDGIQNGEITYINFPKSGENKKFLRIIDLEKIELKGEDKEDGIERWDGVPQIGKEQNYRLSLKGEQFNGANILRGETSTFDNSNVKTTSDGHIIEKISTNSNTFSGNFSPNKDLSFKALIDSKSDDSILSPISLKTENLRIMYNITNNGRSGEANYFLTDRAINGCVAPTLGVKVEGSVQSKGKGNQTTGTTTFSDISRFDVTTSIQKSANELIRNMNSDSTINGIKYVNGNYTIEAQPNYETLIIKNGNLLINKNLNQLNKKLGIIVLDGDIFVTNNVEEINATIYAKGRIASGKNYNGDSYNDDELEKRLNINGTLFTSNTIGGAVKGDAGYLLPLGKTTTDFNEAQKYDLNFMRKVPFTCGDTDYYSVKIKYDPKIQTNPPKGFTIN